MEEKIFNILENINEDAKNIGTNESFFEAGLFDSVDIVELIDAVEQEFDISVKPEEFAPDNFETVEKIISFIKRKISE